MNAHETVLLPGARARRRAWLLATTVALLTGCARAPEEPPDRLHGRLRVVTVDGPRDVAGTRYFLDVGEASAPIRLLFDTPPRARSGDALIVEGAREAGALRVTSASPVPAEPAAAVREPLIAPPSVRARSTALVMVDLGGGVNRTAEFFQGAMFSTAHPGPVMGLGSRDRSVSQYFGEASYGAFTMSGKVEGPLPWSQDPCTGGGDDLLASGLRASVGSHDGYVWFFGSQQDTCGYGWSVQGTRSSPQRDVWINNELWATAIPHEIGHNIGLQHASSMSCGSTPLARDPTTCTTDEYGNPFTIMGSGGVGHLNAVEKWYLGFLGACNAVRVGASGTFSLLPIEVPCDGIQALQIPMPVTGRTYHTEQSSAANPARYYYLELRTGQGLDAGTSPQVVVHISDDIAAPADYCARTALLDMNPGDPSTQGMALGDSFTDPAGGVSFKVKALDGAGAKIEVTLASGSGSNVCLDGSALVGSGPEDCRGNAGTTHALTVEKAGGGSGSVRSSPQGVRCGASCTASFASGTSVSLTATADAGSVFAGWGGACSGTGVCTVSMTAARAVTATFDVVPGSGAGVRAGCASGGIGAGALSPLVLWVVALRKRRRR